MALAACDVGPGTFTYGAVPTAVLTLGPPVGGLEGDISLLTPDSLVVPADAVITNLVPYIKGTSIEVNAEMMDDLWGLVDATGVTKTANVAVATTKTIKTPIAAIMTTDAAVYSITAAMACEFGEVTAEKGDYVKCDFTFKGINASGTEATATYTDAV
jgi:hypothetical protein